MTPVGLTYPEVAQKLQQFGPNELPTDRPISLFNIIWRVVREPTLALLITACALYLSLGALSDAIFLSFSVVFVIALALFQEKKSVRALEMLRDLSSPRALVIREGSELRIAGKELVPGDIVVLHEGDRVPADCALLESQYLKADESMLTGESVPVLKEPSSSTNLFLGTLVVSGHGLAQVVATGQQTQIGQIGKSLYDKPFEQTPLQKKMGRLVVKLSFVAIVLSILTTLEYARSNNDWTLGLLAGIAAAISLLPEEFPVVLAVFMSLGAWRIAKRNVLTRKLSAIETLGSINILCVDKTGTLTANQMTVTELIAEGKTQRLNTNSIEALPEHFHQLVEYGVLASHVDPYDPMDKAIRQTLESYLSNTEHIHTDWVLVREYALTDALRAISCVWRSPNRDGFVIAAKGAPESIIDLCHLKQSESTLILSQVQGMAERGLRILAVAKATFASSALPSHPHDFDFEWVGLIGLEDPIRPEVPAAAAQCHEAGIRLIMITGDYPSTAQNIGQQIGLLNSANIVTGEELDRLSDEELKIRAINTAIFARVVPGQKLRIIKALKQSGNVIAMTGDGINDAPALKWADVGIAMGARGTDVAREAADIVLLDDNFASIVTAIRSGRRIFDNLSKAINYLIAVHVPIAGMALLPAILGWPMLMFPVHLVLLEFVIDPASTLVFEAEPEEPNIMKRPPYPSQRPVVSFRELANASLTGVLALGIVFGAVVFVKHQSVDQTVVRTVGFLTLILCNISVIVLNRLSKTQKDLWGNTAFNWIVTIAIGFICAAIYVPYLQGLFRFSPLAPSYLALSLGATIVFVCLSKGLQKLSPR